MFGSKVLLQAQYQGFPARCWPPGAIFRGASRRGRDVDSLRTAGGSNPPHLIGCSSTVRSPAQPAGRGRPPGSTPGTLIPFKFPPATIAGGNRTRPRGRGFSERHDHGRTAILFEGPRLRPGGRHHVLQHRGETGRPEDLEQGGTHRTRTLITNDHHSSHKSFSSQKRRGEAPYRFSPAL